MIGAALAILAAIAAGPDHVRLTPDEIAALPTVGAGAGTSGVEGIRTTVLAGNPQTASNYTIMLQVPANTRIAAHVHRDGRSAVVMSGTWHFGFGDKADDSLARALPAGSYYTEPGDVAHFARTGDQPVTLYISGIGPTDTRYVEMEAAPRP